MKARALDQRAHSGHIPGWRCQWHTKYSARTRERTHEPEQHPQRRGLPGTVGSDEPSDDASRYLHVETIDDAPPAVTLGQPARLDRRTARDLLRHRSSHPLGSRTSFVHHATNRVDVARHPKVEVRVDSSKATADAPWPARSSSRICTRPGSPRPTAAPDRRAPFPRYRPCPAAPARVPPPSCGHLRIPRGASVTLSRTVRWANRSNDRNYGDLRCETAQLRARSPATANELSAGIATPQRGGARRPVGRTGRPGPPIRRHRRRGHPERADPADRHRVRAPGRPAL